MLSLEGACPTLSAARDDVLMLRSGVGKDPEGWEELGAVEWRVLVATGQGLTSAPQHLGEGGKSGGLPRSGRPPAFAGGILSSSVTQMPVSDPGGGVSALPLGSCQPS